MLLGYFFASSLMVPAEQLDDGYGTYGQNFARSVGLAVSFVRAAHMALVQCIAAQLRRPRVEARERERA